MDYEARLSISYYREVAVINEEHHIFLVQHIESHKFFVKKVLDVYQRDIYAQLKNHPIKGVPKIMELFEEDGRLTLIEEYISGQTLEEYLAVYGFMPEEQAAECMIKLCDILSSLHALTPSVIHRDIKPSNVMLTPFGDVVLLDLNAAKYMDTTKSADTVLLGTKGYAAPEQYGFGSSTIQTDIYGIGVLFCQLLTGELPDKETTGGKFHSVIAKCTKMRPADRYSSVEALKNAILSLKPQSQKKILRSGNRIASFLPPGFRSGNYFHMLLAILGYTTILWFGCTMIIENATPAQLLFERIVFTLILLSVVFFTWNYQNMHRFFPFCSYRKKSVRFIAIAVFDLVIFSVMMTLMILVETWFL